MKIKLAGESLILMGICFLDLASTLLLLTFRGASEGNPLMRFYLSYGIGTFVMVKLTLIFLPIFIAEWSRQYNPHFVRIMMRAAIIIYAGSYLLMFLAVNVVPVNNHSMVDLEQTRQSTSR